MKLLIVTVYNSHNSGSFLQAFALLRELQKAGHEVAFLERPVKGTSHDKKNVAVEVLINLGLLRLKQAIFLFRQWLIYEKLQKELPIESYRSDFCNSVDCIILGSDTIWNFNFDYFTQNASRYLGYDFRGKHVISYAASAANTTSEKFRSVISQYDNLSYIDTILVRDKHTKQLVESTTKNRAYIVTDPTLIASKEIFDSFKVKKKIQRPYLLLYFFGKITTDLQESLIRYAETNHLAIVSMPLIRSWCDYSEMSSPQNMISYFSSAQAIITDTFHGTAFSMVYGKPFAVHDDGKIKISELLSLYKEEQRLFKNPEKISDILSIKNNDILSKQMDIIRTNSVSLLLNSL